MRETKIDLRDQPLDLGEPFKWVKGDFRWSFSFHCPYFITFLFFIFGYAPLFNPDKIPASSFDSVSINNVFNKRPFTAWGIEKQVSGSSMADGPNKKVYGAPRYSMATTLQLLSNLKVFFVNSRANLFPFVFFKQAE